MSAPSPRSSTRFPTIPSGEVVGSYETYEAAQSAVDRLVRADFPLGDVSIVGSNLKSVERVTGKMNAGRAALSGLLSGVMLGIFVGLLALILMPESGIAALIPIMLVAIGFSVLWSLIGFMMNPAKKEFTSAMQILAAHFDIVVTPTLAGRARQTLGTQAPAAPVSSPVASSASAAWHVPPTHDAATRAPVAHDPAADAGRPDAGAPAQPEAPAQPPRTYGEAQDALRREREARGREETIGGDAER